MTVLSSHTCSHNLRSRKTTSRKRPRRDTLVPTCAAPSNFEECIEVSAASATAFFVLILWFSVSALEELYLAGDPNSDHPLDLMLRNRATQAPKPRPQKALLFEPFMAGQQGTGNVINGLLSSHLLADEFDRTVCISPNKYSDFIMAFKPLQTPREREFCEDSWKYAHHNKVETVSLINFGKAPNECEIREKMMSEAHLKIKANTYPRWSHVSKGYFLTHYEATPLLEAVVPWPDPPEVVVHLRKEDGQRDKRDGLDEDTFHALGKHLSQNTTFLVTNKVEWYDWFAEKYGWKNPGWHEVKHSAIKTLDWGSRSESDEVNTTMSTEDKAKSLNITKDKYNTLTMWSDWYTMVVAKKVIHTHSDFSLSAIHWMNTESKTIKGMRDPNEEEKLGDVEGGIWWWNDKVLDLWEEEWYRDGETPRLVDRPPDKLKGCSPVQIAKLTAQQNIINNTAADAVYIEEGVLVAGTSNQKGDH